MKEGVKRWHRRLGTKTMFRCDKNYADNWAEKMTEAYKITSENSELPNARGKSCYLFY